MRFDFENAKFEIAAHMHQILRNFGQIWCRNLRYDSTSRNKSSRSLHLINCTREKQEVLELYVILIGVFSFLTSVVPEPSDEPTLIMDMNQQYLRLL